MNRKIIQKIKYSKLVKYEIFKNSVIKIYIKSKITQYIIWNFNR